jgi:hypothetical protein
MTSPIIAHSTLSLIVERLEADSGSAYRQLLRGLMPQAEDAYSAGNESLRRHLGASIIGKECTRAIWYGFRWTAKPAFPARMLRLFNRGHLEEPRMVALLKMIGCEVWQFDANGKQFRVSDLNGHFAGSVDGVCKGLPDLADTPCVVEFKTHNDKSFAKLAGNDWKQCRTDPKKHPFKGEGVRNSKFEHYVQMQIYMGKLGLHWALYMAVNKNDDELYAEFIEFDRDTFESFIRRADDVIGAIVAPAKINASPTWYSCRICQYTAVCHSGAAPATNCRTCAHSRTGDNGSWLCGVHDAVQTIELSYEDQLAGCKLYELMPALRK